MSIYNRWEEININLFKEQIILIFSLMKIFLNFTFNDKKKRKSYSYNIDDDGSKEVKDFLSLAIIKHNSFCNKDDTFLNNKIKEDIDLYEKKLMFKKDNESVELTQLVKNISNHSIVVDLDNNIYLDEDNKDKAHIEPIENQDMKERETTKLRDDEEIKSEPRKEENINKPKINKIKNYEIEQKESGGICCCLKAFFKC